MRRYDPQSVTAFAWESTWLQASEYEEMLKNAAAYTQSLGVKVCAMHPGGIYSAPADGSVYFLKGKTLTHDLVFSQGNRRHEYRWKKLGPPKRTPKLVYLTATASPRSNSRNSHHFRMYAVTLTPPNGLILCHVRRDGEAAPKTWQDENEIEGKRNRKESGTKEADGLHALLEAAKALKTDNTGETRDTKCENGEMSKEAEVDYVSLFHCPSMTKFPLFSGSAKPPFEIIHRKVSQHAKAPLKTFLEFYSVLATFSKTHSLHLNIPETLIFGYGIPSPALLRTSQSQTVEVCENLTSPEYSPRSVVAMLLGCARSAKPPVPLAVYKESNGESSDLCIPIMTLQAGQEVWNTRLSHYQPAFIQRYIYNGSPCAFVLRATFQPTLNNFSYQVFQNVIPVAVSRNQFYKTLRYSHQETREPIRRRKASVIQLETDEQDYTPSERFCVTTSVPETFEVSSWGSIESIKAQMLVVRWVLERGYLSNFSLGVLEVVADFCQDRDRKWFLTSVHSYKTELVVKKKINTNRLSHLLSRLMAPGLLKLCRPKSANPPRTHKKKRRLHKKRVPTSAESLLSIDDLHQTMVDDILRDIKLHPVRVRRRRVPS